MALTLEAVLAQIDTLETAIATGQLSVAYADRRVQYRDLNEMFRALDWLTRKAASLAGTTVVARQIRMVTGDGHGSSGSSS